MTTEDTSFEKALAIWNDETQLAEVKEIYAPKLTKLEFKTFVQMGIATGLNPFLREIWAVKYDEKSPAQIFIGRDGYRKVISRNKQYEYHHVDAIYSNDDFSFDLTKGEVKHTYNLKDRGKLMGAYCLTFMKTSPKPFYVFVELGEYDTNQSVWKNKKATMIKKVAEAQSIRMADSSTFGGTYSEDEFTQETKDVSEKNSHKLNKKLGLAPEQNTYEGEVVNENTGEITPPPAENTEPQNSGAPSFDEIANQMKRAASVEDLILAKDAARSAGFTPDQMKEIEKIYKLKQTSVK